MWGRREGEWMSLTCPQPFVHQPLRGVMWVCEGHFRIPWFFAFDPSDNCLVHLKLAFSPINENSQSEGFGLVVRRERTGSPSGRTNLFCYTSFLLERKAVPLVVICRFALSATTMLVNFIITLSAATGSAVIMITSCVVENSLTCDIQAVDKW